MNIDEFFKLFEECLKTGKYKPHVYSDQTIRLKDKEWSYCPITCVLKERYHVDKPRIISQKFDWSQLNILGLHPDDGWAIMDAADKIIMREDKLRWQIKQRILRVCKLQLPVGV